MIDTIEARNLAASPPARRAADLPRVGMVLEEAGGFRATVSVVFPAGQNQGMILEWRDDRGTRRAQAFTTRD